LKVTTKTTPPITWLIPRKTKQRRKYTIEYKSVNQDNEKYGTKTSCRGLVAYCDCDSRPGNELGLFYSCRAHVGRRHIGCT